MIPPWNRRVTPQSEISGVPSGNLRWVVRPGGATAIEHLLKIAVWLESILVVKKWCSSASKAIYGHTFSLARADNPQKKSVKHISMIPGASSHVVNRFYHAGMNSTKSPGSVWVFHSYSALAQDFQALDPDSIPAVLRWLLISTSMCLSVCLSIYIYMFISIVLLYFILFHYSMLFYLLTSYYVS